MKTYRVWIEVEEYDTRTDDWTKVDCADCSYSCGAFETKEDAMECVSTLANEIENNNWESPDPDEEPENGGDV